jgi:hypothetical protein
MEQMERNNNQGSGLNVTQSLATQSTSNHNHSTQGKLPKLELRKFSGDYMEWPNFWDSFKVNIHDRSNLENTFKMEYLLQSLSGEPLEKIKGLGIQGNRYGDAVNILQEHYGNPTIREEEAIKALTHLLKIKDNWSNLSEYINRLQCVKTSLVRSEVSKEAIDIYVPFLFESLPDNMKVKIQEMRLTKEEEKTKWEIERYIHYLNDVLYIYPMTKEKPERQKPRQHVPTFYQEGERKIQPKYPCAFCNIKGHFSDLCRKVKDVKKRREILAEKKLCFNCLVGGHMARDCTRTMPCFTCKKGGHHTSVCYGKKPYGQEANKQKTPKPSQTGGSQRSVQTKQPTIQGE